MEGDEQEVPDKSVFVVGGGGVDFGLKDLVNYSLVGRNVWDLGQNWWSS